MFDNLDPSSKIKAIAVIIATVAYYIVLFMAQGAG